MSLFTSNLAGPPGNFAVYERQRGRSISARAVDAVLYRLAPSTAWLASLRRDVSTTVRRMTKEQALDVLELEEFWGIGSWVRRTCGVRVHVRLHGPWFLNGPALGTVEDGSFHRRVQLEGMGIAEADVVSAPSRDVLERVRARYGLTLADAVVIPNPTHPISLGERWRLGACDLDRVLFVGRFDRHKGGDVAIDAFARLLRARPSARLTFVGPDHGIPLEDGSTRGLEAFVRERVPGALEDGRIDWLGAQPYSALAPLRRRAFMTVVSSRYENFPGTLTEAMTMGCPVLAANVGGIPELVQHGLNGLLHRNGDAGDLAARMLELFQDPARAARLGRQAGEDAERRHHPDLIAAQLEQVLMRIIARRRGTA